MLNNYFEFLFSDLLYYFFTKNSGSIRSQKISISLEELSKYKTIEEAYEDLILKEVEAILLEKNFEELKSYFTKDLKVSLEEDSIDWQRINEIRERRHILVHNNSIVNNKYLSRSTNPYKLKLGDEIKIESEYFITALSEIKLAGLLILFNCWGKWDKDSTTMAIKEIVTLVHDLLKVQQYRLVDKICNYVENYIEPKNDDEEDSIYRIKYNHCLALKRMGNQEVLNVKLKSIKVGIMTPVFKMAHHILKNEYDNAIKLMAKAKMVDELTIADYENWSIFEEIRNSEKLNREALKILN